MQKAANPISINYHFLSIIHVGFVLLEGDVLIEFGGAFVALNLKFQQASNLQIPITSIHLSDIVA